MAVAAVCTWWRASAIQHPMYYRPWAYVFPPSMLAMLNYGPERADPQQFEHVIAESEAKGYNLTLNVFIHFNELASLQETVMPVVRRALARCLVLNIHCDVYTAPLLWNGLTVPAPLLQRLTINVNNWDTVNELMDCDPLPEDFLASDAPRLTEVRLSRAPVSAYSASFPSVHSLSLMCLPSLAGLRAAFPNTSHLTIERLPDDYESSDDDDVSILRGLRSLRLGPKNVQIIELVPALKHYARVPLIEYLGKSPEDFSDLLPESDSISVHIFERRRDDWDDVHLDVPPRFGQLCLEFRSGDLTRRVDSDIAFSESFELPDLGRVISQITEFTIDDRHVRTLMHTWESESFSRLRILRITLIIWASVAPGVALTPDEELVYAPNHVRGHCACLGGPFSDLYDGSYPNGDVYMEFPVLETLELCATRPHATVSRDLLRALARSFGTGLHLVLSNGLTLAQDVLDADVHPLFATISCEPVFRATLPYVSRAQGLLAWAASERKDAIRDMDHALRTHGAEFHWAHCDELHRNVPSPIWKEDSRLATL
ncbi:hypothetical protein AURDEDRAFT_113432 [Auricularia subglabra TFB-10046 SS5]|nr:hypothetical protein AURDEDRAFT_113432 [Auricularia subglabra TFB-10046 SS5]